MTVTDDDKMLIGHNSLLSQRFHEAWDRLEGIGATLGEDGGEGGGESPVIGHYVLLCGAGCCLRAHGFSGHRARLWGRAAVCASGRRGQSLPPMGAEAWPYGACRTASDGGFALHEALLRRIDGVSEPHVVQFPPV